LKKLIYILLFLGLQLAALSGNADKVKTTSRTIAGKITDSYGEAIAGAKVSVAETGEIVYADLDGNFKLTVKTDKEYSITVNTIGFEPLSVRSTGLGAFSDLSLKSL
jgi:carboxypeptidase-like protein